VQLQAPEPERARARLPLADDPVPARAWEYRHLQPLLLRGSADCPRASADSSGRRLAGRRRRAAHLEGAVSLDPRLREAPPSKRHARREVLSSSLEERAAPPSARPDR